MPRLVSFNVIPRVLLLSNITAAAKLPYWKARRPSWGWGWVSFWVWSPLGVKKVLAFPGLLSFNFKLMSEHPFHFLDATLERPGNNNTLYATTVLLQPAFYFLYYVTLSSRTVVSKIYLIKRASHDKINGSFLTIRLDNLRLLDSLSQII